MLEAQCFTSEIRKRYQPKKQDSLSAGQTSLSDKFGVDDLMILSGLSYF